MSPVYESFLLPTIYPFVEELILNGRIGICAGNMRMIDVQSGSCTLRNGSCGDRFKLIIPYAGQSVAWEVVFFGNATHFPPDFLFDDRSFSPDLESIESLNNWKSDDPKSLLRIVQELMQMYRKHQVTQIEEMLQFEYNSLIQDTAITESDIEVQVQKTNRTETVNFLIKLPIDFSQIPNVLCKGNPGADSAVLLITFHSPEGRVAPQLFLSPGVEEALGGSSLLRIPSFPNGCGLLDYVPNVCQLLKNKVEQIVNGFDKRKEYFAAFLSHYGRSLLEYDTVGLTKMSFLMEWSNFYFLLTIEMPRYFPHECPVYVFQSIYHATRGRPYTTTKRDYPYSPRWSGDEMAQRARLFILEFIPSFQKASITRIK